MCRMECRCLACALLQDIAGDAFFFQTVVESKQKEWVGKMLIPYAVFFAAASSASLVAGTVKLRLLAHKWRSRVQTGNQNRRPSLGGVPISPHLSSHESVVKLKHRLDERQLERYKYYCYLLAAVAKDIPMGAAHPTTSVELVRPHQRPSLCGGFGLWAGTMNTIYIVRMMDECVRTFNSETSQRVCDLVPSKTPILFLSTSARQLTLGPRDAGFAHALKLRI